MRAALGEARYAMRARDHHDDEPDREEPDRHVADETPEAVVQRGVTRRKDGVHERVDGDPRCHASEAREEECRPGEAADARPLGGQLGRLDRQGGRERVEVSAHAVHDPAATREDVAEDHGEHDLETPEGLPERLAADLEPAPGPDGVVPRRAEHEEDPGGHDPHERRGQPHRVRQPMLDRTQASVSGTDRAHHIPPSPRVATQRRRTACRR
jgi:hypothetical protein